VVVEEEEEEEEDRSSPSLQVWWIRCRGCGEQDDAGHQREVEAEVAAEMETGESGEVHSEISVRMSS